MKSVDEQLARVLTAAVRPVPVRVAISEAQGLLCAEEVTADRALPDFDQAAVDGYAVRSVDVQSAAQESVALPVVGETPAGARQARRLQPAQAVHVEASAPLPTLADAVVPVAYTEEQSGKVVVRQPVPSGAFIRRAGEDVQPGDVAVHRGMPIGPAQLAMLAAIGRSQVLVHPRPRVSIISVGEELVDLNERPGTGQTYDVNSYALAAAAREAGAEVTRVGIVPTDSRRLREVVEGRLLLSEVVVIAGGAGGAAGERVRAALAELGRLEITRVAMHPGSVQGFGRLGPDQVPTFILPSSPVSALVVFEVFVRPLIRFALGKTNPHRRTVTASTLSPISSTKGRRGFLRGQLLRDPDTETFLVQPLGDSESHLLAPLVEANCLIVVDEDITDIPVGEDVPVRFLSQRS